MKLAATNARIVKTQQGASFLNPLGIKPYIPKEVNKILKIQKQGNLIAHLSLNIYKV